MATTPVTFKYLTGIKKNLFSNVRIQGSWDNNGIYNDSWSISPMQEVTGEDGCPAFSTTIELNSSIAGQVFKWGVVLDGPAGTNIWGINTELDDAALTGRYCTFIIDPTITSQTETFYFTYKRKLGANLFYAKPGAKAHLQFSVWAPNAKNVEVVFGTKSGYIHIDGTGIDSKKPVVAMAKGDNDIWESAPIPGFSKYEGHYYMFRITNRQGQVLYRTDIFSRGLAGRGSFDPESAAWDGTLATLDGTVSCSIITDPDAISSEFPLPLKRKPKLESADDFWRNEFNPDKPIPTSIDDIVIYELHVGALGNTPGIPATCRMP